jgi:predicted negative regulator of RcsB-dependent stress response
LGRRDARAQGGVVWILAFSMWALLGCGAAQPTPSSAATARIDAGLVVGVQGNAAVKRNGWRDYAPALLGTPLRRGDLLRLESTGSATVACADLKLATIASGVSGYPCQAAPKTPLVYEGALLTPTRGDSGSGEYPRIVSPRRTKLIDPHPVLRWQPLSEARTYKVSLQGANWSAEVSGAHEVPYPADAPALQPGVNYRLVVTSGDRSSSEEPGAGLAFTLATAEEVRSIREAEARIRSLGLAETATALLVANVYATNGLHAEAIEGLERLPGPQEPAVLRLLGDLYIAVGLNQLAEERYTAALTRSETLNDIEGQAQAHHALGRIFGALGNPDDARRHFSNALTLYDRLGDAKKAAEAKAQLDALPQP